MYKSIYNLNIRKTSCFIFFILVSCSVMGQAKPKKQLTNADYHLWSTLDISGISSTGLWVSYSLRYESDKDTLFVKKADTKKTYSYPLGRKGKFSGDQWYACIVAKRILKLTHLKNGKQEIIEDVNDYEFSSNGKYLVTASKAQEGRKTLMIRNLTNGVTQKIENTSSWAFNNNNTLLAYCVQNGLDSQGKVVSIKDTIQSIAELPFEGNVGSAIVWQKNSASLVFVLQTLNELKKPNLTATKLAQYRFANSQLLVLEPKSINSFPKDKHIESNSSSNLKISDDGKRIFFQVLPDIPTNSFDTPLVEVWHGDDKIIYSEQKLYGHLDEWAKTAVWYTDANEVFEFMPQETHMMLSGDQQFALTSSLEPCELQFKYAPDRDYYLTNLATKERKLWLQCHSPEMHHTIMSPSGKYITYFMDGHWYMYTLATGEHKNLTSGLGVAFYDEANDIGDKPDTYGFAGWTANDKSIVIYDQFDIWQVPTDGTSAKRLTNGRERNICYRITKTNSAKQSPFLSVNDSNVIDLNTALVLKASLTDNSMQGYYIFDHGKVTPLQFSPHRINDLKKASGADVYIFLQEDYEHPTSLQVRKGKDDKPKSIYQGNTQHSDYFWGKITTINYASETGVPLKGLLYYPSDYKKGTAYPMIVHVYQKQAQNIYNYINPSGFLEDGFNVTNFVTQGYFVLLPDIEYIIGTPGDSAVFCVTAAVNNVLSKGDVNPKRVGLIGHSFGGFETTYIITKSNLFATAVAGAAQTDYLSGYFTVSENYKRAEFWRYEYFTNRMVKPLFADFEGYLYNSPVYKAPDITTPLLLWTGEKDKHVAATQSMELYLAMRRLGKNVTMLRYPNEDHSLENPDKQVDLAQKIREWFDHYLKGTTQKEWMVKGL